MASFVAVGSCTPSAKFVALPLWIVPELIQEAHLPELSGSIVIILRCRLALFLPWMRGRDLE
jgi:hypothetical protein